MKKPIRQSLQNYLKKICPYAIIKIYKRLYSVWCQIRSFIVPVSEYSGLTNFGGSSLKFSYIGWDHKILSYWLNSIYTQNNLVWHKKLIPVWKVTHYINKNKKRIDIVLVEMAIEKMKQQISEEPGFILPRWIKMHLNVDLSLSIIGKHHFISRHIKKFSLESEMGNSEQDFIFFYENMYRPYIVSRHKDSAVIEEGKTMLKDFKGNKSRLYFVIKDGTRIAGLWEQNENGIPYLHAFGVLSGSDEIMRMGVIGALYYFAISDHQKNGIKFINIGGASPLLKDGLTHYKLLLGGQVSEIQKQDSLRLKLLPLKYSSAVDDFLRSNPFIYIENESIYCAVFKAEKDAGPDEEFQKQVVLANKAGAKETRVFRLNSLNWLEYDSYSMDLVTNINHTKHNN
jgi:hypothetical protein